MSPDTERSAPTETSIQQGIQSVEIAMTVLVALEEGGSSMPLTQVAFRSGMSPSKVHRYLVSLSRIGLVSQSPTTGRYDLGPALRRIGVEALRRMDEVGVVSECLPGLRDRTGHSVNLSVWGDHGPVVVRWQYGSFPLPITVRIGATLPLLSSSVGRVFLTCLPAILTTPVVREQDAAAGSVRVDQGEIEAIRSEVRRAGVAVITGAVIPGVTSVAAPVMTNGESLPLVVSIALPDRAATRTVMRAVTQDLLQTTQALSADMGYRSDQRA